MVMGLVGSCTLARAVPTIGEGCGWYGWERY